jgi:hypothetical protein
MPFNVVMLGRKHRVKHWFSLGNPVSPTNKSDPHDIAEILLKVALNTINQPT